MAKKKAPKEPPIDGLSSNDLKRINQHVRKVWQWSTPWRLAKKRVTDDQGYVYCEGKSCPYKGDSVPKVFVDHIEPVGEIGGPDYIKRTFVPSAKLQCLCKRCHDKKTKAENRK